MGIPAGNGKVAPSVMPAGTHEHGRRTSVHRFAVSRVGALAATVGIGAAVFALPGLALADTGAPEGGGGSESTSSVSGGAEHGASADTGGSDGVGGAGTSSGASRDAEDESSADAEDPAGASDAGAASGVSQDSEDESPADAEDTDGGSDAGPPSAGPQEGSPATEVESASGTSDSGPSEGLIDTPNSTLAEANTSGGEPTESQTPVGNAASPSAGGVGTDSQPDALSATPAETTTDEPAVPAAATTQSSSEDPDVAAMFTTSASEGPMAFSTVSAASTTGQIASRPVAQLVRSIDGWNQAVVRGVYHVLVNWLSTLPVNSLTSWLDGALAMVRRSLLNQSAGVHSVQQANSPTLVTGKIDVIDPEGDAWKVELVGGPSHGTVVLGNAVQTDGIGSISYSYTAGDGYAGHDQFVVKVSPTGSVFNILHPFGVLDSRTYTVAVGAAAEAAKDQFTLKGADPKDTPDTHLFLSNAAVAVTVKKQGGLFNPKYTATVTLPSAMAAKSFAWMDTRGNAGSIPVDTMLADDWGDYSRKAAANGVKPLLTFRYVDQGVEKAVFIDVRSVTKNANGSYTFSGGLKNAVPAQDGRVDTWDFTGKSYKAAYDNFLNSAAIKNCKSGRSCTTVLAIGVLGTTTLSPSAFTDAGGHDYPKAAPEDTSTTESNSGSETPAVVSFGAVNSAQAVGSTGSPAIELTAMIPWGTDGSFIGATNLSQADTTNNGIFLFTAQAPKGGEPTWTKTLLVGNTWDAAVNVMAEYNQVLTDATGKPVLTTYTGTVSGANAVKLAVTGGIDPSSLIGQQITGQGIAPNTQTTGFVSSDVTGVTYSLNNAIQPSSGSIAVTLPNKVTTQPGLLIGLSDGSVYYWNGTGCTTTTCVGPVVNGTDSASAIPPTAERVISMATASPVSTSVIDRPASLNSSSSGSAPPA